MWKLFWADLKMLFRNHQSLRWALMFPLLFTFIFGFFFGKNTNIGTIAVINDSNTEISAGLVKTLESTNVFKVQEENNLDNAKDEIKRSKISAVVYIPRNFGSPIPDSPKQINVIYDPGSAQVSSGLSGIVDKYLTAVNYQIQQSKPIYGLQLEPVNDRQLNYFNFVLAGILGLALMNSSVIGVGVSMARYREDQILKRITTTPVKSIWFIVAEILSRLVINLIQIGLILSIGVFFFGAHIYGNIFIVLMVAMIGAVMFQLFGFVVASFSKTTDTAQGMATAITIPMMFLAGVFFPIDSLPKWLYYIVQYLPLAPILRILRSVALEGASPFFEPRNAIIIVAWLIITLTISSWKFRLADE